jgi:sortase A
MSARSLVRGAAYVFVILGVLALGVFAVTWLESRVYQKRAARRFAGQTHLAAPTLKTPPETRRETPWPAPKEGAIVGKLVIPRIGISVVIVEGIEDGDLKHAVGHIPGTALPGNDGNIGLAGHRDTFFRPLRLIRRNDALTLLTVGGMYRYRVVSTKIVGPDDVRVLYPDGRDVLTLVTCYPFYYVGSAPKRFIVQAERVPDSMASAGASAADQIHHDAAEKNPEHFRQARTTSANFAGHRS